LFTLSDHIWNIAYENGGQERVQHEEYHQDVQQRIRSRGFLNFETLIVKPRGDQIEVFEILNGYEDYYW